jgi:hypothetical protein
LIESGPWQDHFLRQAFVGELVEQVEHPIPVSIMGAVLDKSADQT